ncbi:hypothetical protein BCR34DRAFT_606671 [Clohesyomyces aquaticus]|uniref:Uncharacterized protein n=1 Tax=Clohesyomyces aquaticus TaxID=1231657 RepID=A0A1Y1YMP4_9PLEO|nr:hypothetical protein BCR34DRAFT_606671 [Clohesyomyces aquaticus]
MISQLVSAGHTEAFVKKEGWLKSMARARLSQMPRSVKCAPTGYGGELRVTWESVESRRNSDYSTRIILHHCLPYIIVGVTFLITNRGQASMWSPPTPRSLKLVVDSEDLILSRENAFITKHSETSSMASDFDNPYGRAHEDSHISRERMSRPRRPSCSRESAHTVRNGTPSSLAPEEPFSTRTRRPSADVESYMLGDKIEHRDLAWANGFPSTHSFYRTREDPDQTIFIAKPKPEASNTKPKSESSPAKRKCDADSHDASPPVEMAKLEENQYPMWDKT